MRLVYCTRGPPACPAAESARRTRSRKRKGLQCAIKVHLTHGLICFCLFLGGLRWHLSGLSELPLEQRLRLLLAGEHFSFFVLCCRRTIYFAIFCLCGPFFCTWTSMFIVEHLTAVHIVLQYRKHSTAQRNQPAQSRKASTLRSECDNADSWREPAKCCQTFVQHAEFSKRTKQSKSARPRKIYNYSQRCWCGARSICR